MDTFIKAAHFAAVKHKDQRRKDEAQTPYINHPIGVAHHLIEFGVTDTALLCAAVLHDTVEDTETTFEEIEDAFGNEIKCLVEEVTNDGRLPKAERKRLEIEHASEISPRAKLLKLADKLYNLEDLEDNTPQGWSESRVKEYFEWAQKVVDNCKTGQNIPLEQRVQSVIDRNIKS